MIEAIVRYIESKGFSVRVFRGSLRMYKVVGGEQCAYDWALAPFDEQLPFEVVCDEADHLMGKIDEAIELRRRQKR